MTTEKKEQPGWTLTDGTTVLTAMPDLRRKDYMWTARDAFTMRLRAKGSAPDLETAKRAALQYARLHLNGEHSEGDRHDN